MNRVNLKIDVTINDFESPNLANFTRRTREVSTDSNLGSGDVLALGGLLQDIETAVRTETPIIGKIPIIGWLFSKTSVDLVRSNIVVFICPTIVEPKFKAGMNRYTTDKIRAFDQEVNDSDILDNDRDPITHLFFNTSDESRLMMDQYLNEAKNTTIKPKNFREDVRKITATRATKTPEMSCAVIAEKVPSEPAQPKKILTQQQLAKEKITELIAMEENPFSGIKQIKS